MCYNQNRILKDRNCLERDQLPAVQADWSAVRVQGASYWTVTVNVLKKGVFLSSCRGKSYVL